MLVRSTQKHVDQIRDGESFPYAREIYKPFGQLAKVLTWCRTELDGDWRWQLVRTSTDREPGRYIFYFDTERDLFAFTLQWA